MAIRATLIFLCAFFSTFCVQANPANVLVRDLTFTRPEKWIWEAPSDQSSAITQFIVPSTPERKSRTEVRFYVGPKDGKEMTKVWRSQFVELKDDPRIGEEKKKVGKRVVTYVFLRGVYSFDGTRKKPYFSLLGAVIPSGKEFIHVRMVGPQSDVERATSDFKNMIETAVKEKEPEDK